MSQQAGIWHYNQQPIAGEQLTAFERQLVKQGPDSRGDYLEPGFAMLHRAFQITAEDVLEIQPVRTSHGNVLTWDGRLDNRDELLATLGRPAIELPTDVEIVSASISAWGANALQRFIGDWALSWWEPRARRLLLARDYIGIRKLYYLALGHSFYWSTDLAALVLHSGQRYTLCDSYFAGYFTNYPEPQLTPYQEIQLVPPGGYLEVTSDKVRVRRYWSFNGLRSIRYKSDADYEEHFRTLFRQSVTRRLRTVHPILADLSGGLDSSSIVCMSHDILKAAQAHVTINTLSYFSVDEISADERSYFAAVEDFIGKIGTHIEDVSDESNLFRPLPAPYFAPLPAYFDRVLVGERQLLSKTAHQGNRVHFSGFGGDELLGGIQNPVPDLASLLWHLRLPSFLSQLHAWALQSRTTLWSFLSQSISSLAPIWIREHLEHDKISPLTKRLCPDFAKQQHAARRCLRPVGHWTEWFPGPPTADLAYLTLASTLAQSLPRFTFADQPALPYYDRDLVEFLFAIPGDQLLRAHQRRSLMRRSLGGIVPDVVLSRKTKALRRRHLTFQMLNHTATLQGLLPGTPIAERYINSRILAEDLEALRRGKEAPLLLLERILGSCLLYRALGDRALNMVITS